MQQAFERRNFLKILGGASLAGCQTAPRTEPAAARRPNIVIIMADDMGFSDIGCYGGEISTPNLGALAENGLRFTQFYNTARCCPTRASLLTGLYQHQAGVGQMVGDLGHPSYQGYLNDSCVTIAEALNVSGYTTVMLGKWHVGEKPQHWPTRRGFDRYFGLISGGSNYFKLDGARQMALNDEPWTPPDDGSFYMTDAFTDHAVEFLDEAAQRDDPFFLYLPFTAPHWPLHAWPEDIAKYKGKYSMGWDELRRQRYARMVELGIIDRKWELSERNPDVPAWDEVDNKPLWERRMEVYAAMVDRMDQGIGRVVDKVREMGEIDNTIILFLADNGGCHESADIEQGSPRNTWGDPNAMPGPADSFDGYDRPWANASNTPFRMFKSWVHEGGISTPLVCHWPAGIRQSKGSLTHEPGHLIDLMATCLDVADADYPSTFKGHEITPLEGKSLRPIFGTGDREDHEALFWDHQGNRAVRMGKWKLVCLYNRRISDYTPWELYDIEVDRSELNDMAADMPEKVAEMEAAWLAWAKKVGWVPWNQLRG